MNKVSISFMLCYYCEARIESHDVDHARFCLERVCKLVREKGGLPFDYADSTRHRKSIVEAFLKEHDLDN